MKTIRRNNLLCSNASKIKAENKITTDRPSKRLLKKRDISKCPHKVKKEK